MGTMEIGEFRAPTRHVGIDLTLGALQTHALAQPAHHGQIVTRPIAGSLRVDPQVAKQLHLRPREYEIPRHDSDLQAGNWGPMAEREEEGQR